MSSTNKTTNYELSQFIGSDKPAWLSDYNGDMGKIDTGIHNAQTTATGADGKADANTTKIGTLANLTTTAKTDLVSAINEVDSNADTAQGAINSVGVVANSAKTTADGLSSYLTLTDMGGVTLTMTNATVNPAGTQMYYAVNSAGTYGKLYGRIRYTSTSASDTVITLATPKIKPTSGFTISCGAMYTVVSGGQFTIIQFRDIVVNTNGTCTITIPASQGANAIVSIWVPPCIYYFSDFGDTPTPE